MILSNDIAAVNIPLWFAKTKTKTPWRKQVLAELKTCGILPQQLGCLQVADTGAAPPALTTPPFQEVPGQTSFSNL